ncbi:phage tail assembly chaperone [Paenibacillus sp. KN14-4R]|uniref:phage tail assembly chaperone n=1 Tax=Paenibacillus sp. KN14-4R TaxID=3445773 RepID=UPI003FA0333B
MTKGLDALLGATLDLKKEVYIPRLKTHFTTRAIDNVDLQKAREQASIYEGTGSKREKRLDNDLFNAVLIAKGCVDPEFSNKALIQRYEASDAADCVKKALLPGELAKLNEAILALSGFGDEEEAIEDATE